jgi:hypothetical protein
MTNGFARWSSRTQRTRRTRNTSVMQKVNTNPRSGVLAAERECSHVRSLTGDQREIVGRAWLYHLVLIFHEQSLIDSQLVAFSRIHEADPRVGRRREFGTPTHCSTSAQKMHSSSGRVLRNARPIDPLTATSESRARNARNHSNCEYRTGVSAATLCC